MRKKEIDYQDVIRKLRGNELPTYREVFNIMSDLEEKVHQRNHVSIDWNQSFEQTMDQIRSSKGKRNDNANLDWIQICTRNNIYAALNEEFVDRLAYEIKGASSDRVLEICAGDGNLSYHIGNRGINITATDDFSWKNVSYGSNVENLDYREALNKYSPEVVVASWMPSDSTIGDYVLKHPDVDHFYVIGSEEGITWSPNEDYTGKWHVKRLESVEEVGINRMDTPESHHHTYVTHYAKK